MGESAHEDFCDGDLSSISNLRYLPCYLPSCSGPVITLAVSLVLFYFVYKWFWRIFTISVQLTGSIRGCGMTQDHILYLNLLTWLAKNVPGFQTTKVTIEAEETDDEDDDDRVAPDQQEWNLEHSAGYGTHTFNYKGTYFLLQRVSTPRVIFSKSSQEIIILTTFRWNKSILNVILEELKPKPKVVKENKLVLYKTDQMCTYWTRLGQPKKKRPLDTIILEGELTKQLMTDINEFLTLEDWYVERGIPYRRGYLIYGPPGCGKSSIIKAIAGQLGYDICILSLSQKLSDDSLTELLNLAPTKSIVLLEDIDAAFKSREEKDGASARETNLAFEGCSPSSLTFRGLLNALDGVASAEDGQLLFMTTNYPERLDPALVRPGRVDLKVFIDYPNDFQLEGMFKRFYPESGSEIRSKFVKDIRALDLKVSMAMVQGLFLMHKASAEEAVEKMGQYFENQYSNVKDLCHGLYC